MITKKKLNIIYGILASIFLIIFIICIAWSTSYSSNESNILFQYSKEQLKGLEGDNSNNYYASFLNSLITYTNMKSPAYIGAINGVAWSFLSFTIITIIIWILHTQIFLSNKNKESNVENNNSKKL